MNPEPTYHHDRRPAVEAICALYAAAPLRRPVDRPELIRQMFDAANVVVSAYVEDRLVGLLRGGTDFVFDGYICDLAVHPDWQGAGVGRALLDHAMALAKGVQWVLLASPLAKDYYAHVGWEKVENGWRMQRSGWSMPSVEAFKAQHESLARRA